MKIGTEYGELQERTDTHGELVYLIDSDPEVLIERYYAISQVKKIIAAYGLNGRHVLVLRVDGIRVRKTKKG